MHMRRWRVGFALLVGSALGAGAQTTDQGIARGVTPDQKSSIEAAKNIFQGIINSKAQVTLAQRVTAYEYLGGYWALVGKPDSARAYFIAAVDNDPFLVELDTAGHFAGDEQAAFAQAKRA